MKSLIWAATVLAVSTAQADTIFVDDDAPNGGDGLSWATAYNDLTDALNAVDVSITQIWVAAGTYTPTFQFTGGAPQSASFWFENNVSLLGGFAGNETDPNDRDPVANATILSGERGVPGDPTDNCDTVIRGFDITNDTAVLDGFTITGGYAQGDTERGGGVNLEGGDTVFINCRFIDNYAVERGGAVWGDGTPAFIDCTFIGNEAGGQGSGGGAIYCSGALALSGCVFQNNYSESVAGAVNAQNATITACVYDGNSANGSGGALIGNGSFLTVIDSIFSNNVDFFNDGGAMINGANVVTIINTTFLNNSAPGRGGAINNTNVNSATTLIGCTFLGNSSGEGGGGLVDWSDTLRVINCTFSGNSSAYVGGAIWSHNDLETTIANCTIVGNTAAQSGGGIYSPDDSTTTTMANTILWSNTDSGGLDENAQLYVEGTLDINYSLVMGLTGGFGGIGNFDADPMLLDAAGDDFTPGTADDDLRLVPGSPCIDVGSNDLVPADSLDLDDDLDTAEPIPFDGYGGTRFYDDPATIDGGQGTPPIVDVGSHEFDETTQKKGPDPGEYVGPSGGSWFVPGNWAGGVVPDSGTNVLITSLVVIDQAGAVANIVFIETGGTLEITTGSLNTGSMTVRPGGLLRLDDTSALLDVGTLDVQTGGIVEWNAGTVNVGVSWSDLSAITVGCAGDATLMVGVGALVSAPVVTVCTTGTLAGSGVIRADVSTDGTTIPGASIGTLTIDGDFTQSVTSTLVSELAGYAPGEFDQLVVTGTAVLGGAFEVITLGGYVPQLAGDQRLVVAEELVGTFAAETIPSLPGLFLFELRYDVPAEDYFTFDVQLVTILSSAGPRLYVNQAAAAGGDGQSWATASGHLQEALGLVRLMAGQITEIWVAAGTHRPDSATGDRSDSFNLAINGVTVYGGFAGSETDLGERDVEANLTILDGDLNGDDGPNFSGNDENSYHVVTTSLTGACELVVEGTCIDGLTHQECNDLSSSDWLGYGTTCATGGVEPITLDGFTITGGNGNEVDVVPNTQGGGIRNIVYNFAIANCTIIDNFSLRNGAGMYDIGETVVTSCTFSANDTGSDGGGYASLGWTFAQFTNCTFEFNNAGVGGGVHLESGCNAVFTGCTFASNYAVRGGAMYLETPAPRTEATLIDCTVENNDAFSHGSGIEIRTDCTLTATGTTFSGNNRGGIRSVGGAVWLTGGDFTGNIGSGAIVMVAPSASLMADGTTFSGNASDARGGAIRLDGGIADLTDCTFTDNTAVDEGGAVFIDWTQTAFLSGGTLSGNSASAGSGIYNRAGNLSGLTTVLGADVLYNGGVLEVGLPGAPPIPGTMTIDGTFHQERSDLLVSPELRLDVGGPMVGEYDRIDASGGAAVLGGGTLLAQLFGGYEPQLGDSFELLATPAITGAFDVALMPGLAAGLFLQVDYGPTGITATVSELDVILSFEDVQLSDLTGTPVDAKLADMDNDDDLDLVVLIDNNPDPGEVVVLLNAGTDGNGQWLGFPGPAVTETVGVVPSALDVGFVNGDTFRDVAVANLGTHTISVLFNDGDGSGHVTLDQDYPVFSWPASVALGREPGNLAVNMASATDGGNEVRHWVNDGSGTFTAGQTFATTKDPVVTRLVDVDLDTDDDLVIVRVRTIPQPYSLEVWIYDEETGTFGDPAYHSTEFGTTDVLFQDLNDDLYPDLVAVSPSGFSVVVNEADGQGTYAVPITIQIGDELDALTIADFDLDGDPDLVGAVRNEANEPTTRVVRNDQNGGAQLTLATAIDLGTGGDTEVLLSGDVDGDGLPDLVVLNPTAAAEGLPTLGIVLNSTSCPGDIDGDGIVGVVDFLALLLAWGPNPGHIADLDGDGVVGVVDFLALLAAWGPCP
jgi:predicted outer membrane repeat protein